MEKWEISDMAFAVVPLEVATDDRLTKMQLRVLIALLSFRAKNTDTVWPKRSSLAKRCGYNERTISKVTTQLVNLGWLEKTGKGGYSQSCHYRITVPELDTVPEAETVPEPDTSTVSKPDTSTVPEPDTRNKQTNEQTNEQTIAFEQFWSAYPNKKSKERARKVWARMSHDEKQKAFADVQARTGRDPEWRKDGGAYIPHGSTYLNNKRWEDEWQGVACDDDVGRGAI